MIIEMIEFFSNNTILLNIAIAITIFFAGLIIGKIASRTLQNILEHTKVNDIIQKTTKVQINISKTAGIILKYAIYFLSTIMALNQIGIGTTILNILSGAILIIVIILVFLAIKDFIPNIAAGIFIHTKNFLNEGDHIKLHDIEGKITLINLIETRIKTKNEDIITIPNSRLIKYEIVKRKSKSKKE